MRVIQRVLLIILVLASGRLSAFGYTLTENPVNPDEIIKFTVSVLDSATSEPLVKAFVTIKQNGNDIETEVTDSKGNANFKVSKEGAYSVDIRMVGYNTVSDNITVNTTGSNSFTYHLSTIAYVTEEIEIVGERENNSQSEINTVTGAQVYNSETTHEPPTSRMTNIIHDNLTGAVAAPTGEVHIRGMHGEFTYVVDGVPVSLGIFGGLNEIVDPKVISKIKFLTGGFEAEYGGQLAAIMDIENRIPAGKLHLDFSTYAGSYLVFNGASPFKKGNDVPTGQSSSAIGDTLGGSVGPFRSINQNGQSLSLSGHLNKLGYFFSGNREETDRRIDTPVPTLYNDHGTDYSLYGKLDYFFTKKDFITTNFNYSITKTQVPFDINAQGFTPDSQSSYNSFETISYTHIISNKTNHSSKLFIGLIGRQGNLKYTPSLVSPVTFQFAGDSTLYALSVNRGFSSYGINTKYDIRFLKSFTFAAGFSFTATSGTADFTSRDSLGNPGPSENNSFKGSDFGVFTQFHITPVKGIGLDFGVRYDQHIAPEVDIQKQFSPRIKLSFLFDKNTDGYLYYGKLFMPTSIEAIKSLASNVTNGGTPTLPEKDDFFEATLIHTFPFGLTAKTAGYYKHSSPGLDDQSIGASAIKTPVNIENVHTTGIELSLSYSHPKIPVSTFLNTAIIHAYGTGAVTGGFLPIDDDGPGTDLDHDQRLTITGGINYHPKKWFVELTENYGSGLTNGNPNGISFKTGIFDFNSDAHVKPWVIFNLGAGYTFTLKKGITIQPSIFLNNILDNAYLLKGAYFSSASFGERRNVILKLELHI
jgi:hypothetical protein